MKMRELVVACAIMGALLTAACRGTPSAPAVTSPPAAIATSTAVGTPTPSPLTFEQEVERAYLAYWEAYSRAVLDLDASRVEGFAAGEELERLKGEIAQLERDGVAFRVVVTHDPLVVRRSGDEASVVDRVVNRSFFVDRVTKLPETAAGSGETLTYTFLMQRVDSRWVVIRGTRARS